MQFPEIPEIDTNAAEKAIERQERLTKPAGSLGRLESLSVQLAGITAKERPMFPRKAVILMAADHGVALEGISAYPSTVTAQMVANIVNQGAAVNVLARQNNAHVLVVDVGVAQDLSGLPGVVHRNLAKGSQNMRQGPALSRAMTEEAINVGMQVLREQVQDGTGFGSLG